MNTHEIKLPPLPEPAWVDGEPYWYDRHMEAYARAAVAADRKRIANAISDRYDNVEAGNVNRDPYHSGMATAYDIAEQIVLGELEK